MIRHLLSAFALGCIAFAANADDHYPSKPIRIVVNSGAGGLMDITTRRVADQMAKKLGQPIIVDNRTGADGLIGIRYAKTAPADGYTLLVSSNTVTQAPAFKADPGYDPMKDFVGIGLVDEAPYLIVGSPSQPAKTLAELVSLAKANPDKLSFASGGVGTSSHMAAVLFIHEAGIKMMHVPYKGNAGAMPDVIGGRVNVIFDGGSSSGPMLKDGKLHAFGITYAKRSPSFPQVPTLAEQGLPNYSFSVWHGLFAPAGTPKWVVQQLNEALRFALTSESVREGLKRDGAQAGQTTPEQFTEFLRQDMLRTMKVVTDLGLSKD
jgi:tripartite-type tricarboxylate transporter receptor subunit TctC